MENFDYLFLWYGVGEVGQMANQEKRGRKKKNTKFIRVRKGDAGAGYETRKETARYSISWGK